MRTPKLTAVTIRTEFNSPSVPKDSLTKIVEITNPELRITLLNLSVCGERKQQQQHINKNEYSKEFIKK